MIEVTTEAAEHIRGSDAVVYSSAIAKTNPEFAAAKADGSNCYNTDGGM